MSKGLRFLASEVLKASVFLHSPYSILPTALWGSLVLKFWGSVLRNQSNECTRGRIFSGAW